MAGAIKKHFKDLRWCVKCRRWHRKGSAIFKQHREFLRIITK